MNFPFPPFPHYPPYSQNFQYAVPPQYAPYSLPPPDGAMPSPYVPATVMPSKAPSDQGTPHSVTGPGQQDDDDAEPERTARRLAWIEEEDVRLVSILFLFLSLIFLDIANGILTSPCWNYR